MIITYSLAILFQYVFLLYKNGIILNILFYVAFFIDYIKHLWHQ